MQLRRFDSRADPGTEAIVVIFDLQGFSRFFTQQDVHLHVPDYLNVVFDAFHELFKPQVPEWLARTDKEVGSEFFNLPEPAFTKFMGDGALYVWTVAKNEDLLDPDYRCAMLNNLYFFKSYFDVITKRAREVVPLIGLPNNVRVGVTRGTVYGLRDVKRRETIDYVGFTINLAARLQSYCRELGFVASARLGIPDKLMKEMGYIKFVATEISGFDLEYVWVESDDFKRLPRDIRRRLFAKV